MHYLFFVMRRHKRISLLGYIMYNTYYIGRPHALMRGQTSPQSINEKTTTCDRVDMENNNGLSYCEYFMRSGANENIIKLFLYKYKQTIFTREQKNLTVSTNNFCSTKNACKMLKTRVKAPKICSSPKNEH